MEIFFQSQRPFSIQYIQIWRKSIILSRSSKVFQSERQRWHRSGKTFSSSYLQNKVSQLVTYTGLYYNLWSPTLQKIDVLLSELNYIRSTLFLSEVSYVEFLDRVHLSEIKLREKGLWEVPHPWLNLLIPRSRIREFAAEVFGHILPDTSNGPILIYPVNKSKYELTIKSKYENKMLFL